MTPFAVPRTHFRRRLGYAGVAVALALILLALALTFVDWNMFKGPIERAASARLGRAVKISGALGVRIWSRTPTIILTGLSIGNPPWEPTPALAKIERAQIQLELLSLLRGRPVLRHVELIHPELYLHQEKSGRANWTFENNAPGKERASKPTRLPAIRDLVIESGTLELLDELRHLKVKGTVEAHESASREDPRPFHLEGTGTINEKPFRLEIAGGALRALSPGEPYPFALAIEAGDTHIKADGKVLKPFDLGALELDVDASGKDLAELFYLTQITLPNTPPYKLQARISRDGSQLHVRQIAGSLGGSDVSGSVDIDASTKRPLVRADLVSRHLFLKDFAALTGSQAQSGASLSPGEPAHSIRPGNPAPPVAKSTQLFPDARLQVDRLRAVDADVHFRATSVDAGIAPVTEVTLHAKLDRAILTLEPLQFDMAQGHLDTQVRIDGRSNVPQVHMELRAKDIQLAQFKGKGSNARPPLEGTLEARAVLDGKGDSVHALMSNADGRLTAIIPNGDIRSAFAQLTGVDVAAAMGLLLRKGDARDPIRCGVAEFGVQNGTARTQDFVVDTQNMLITGHGEIFLGPERLDLTIQGQPKQIRLVRVRAPVRIRGQLLHPSFGLEVGHALKQGGIAAALGLLTPLGALLAFVDPGLAKDRDCAQLLAQTQQQAPAVPAAEQGK